MKHLLTACFIIIYSISYSQIQDLSSLTSGDFVGFDTLFKENDEFFGYVVFFSKGKVDEEQKKFEYIILDKNLNEVMNNEFVTNKYARGYNSFFNRRGELIFSPSFDASEISFFKARQFKSPEAQIVDLKTGNVTPYDYYCFENNQFIECPANKEYRELIKDNKKELKEKGFVYKNTVFILKSKGFLVEDWESHKNFVANQRMMVFDENQNQLWEKEFGEGDTKKKFTSISVFKLLDDKVLVHVYKHKKKGEIEQHFLTALNLKTGETLFEKDITEIGDTYNKYSVGLSTKEFNNRVINVGIRADKEGNSLGFYRMLTNTDKGKIDFKKIAFSDLKPYLPKINAFGKVENNYYLRARATFPFEDGSVAILTEKYKLGYDMLLGAYKPKTRDFVMIYTNPDFSIKQVEVIEKDKTKWATTDYLFSQRLNYGKDIVFYYADYRKDETTKNKDWILGINTIIDGEFKNEEIPISSENNLILPHPAKEGYIMLQEFNKKTEYNQIRLERLNF